MRPTLLMLLVLTSPFCHGQKTEVGLTVAIGVPVINSSRIALLENLYSGEQSYYTYSADRMRPVSNWNKSEFQLNIYPKDIPDLSISIGVRMFHFAWEIDSVVISVFSGSVSTGSLQSTGYYGRKELHLGYMLPTLSLGYSQDLHHNFGINYAFSLGITSFFEKRWISTKAYGGGQGAFDYADKGYEKPGYDFDFDDRTFDFQANLNAFYKFGNLWLTVGPAFYHFVISNIKYTGLNLNAGLSLRFPKKVPSSVTP